MKKTNPNCANGPRWLMAGLVVAALSSLLAGCLPPPRRSAPPAPPHPGAWIHLHADRTA